MKHVKQMHVRKNMSVGDLVEEMMLCGVLGAGRIGKATELVAEMFEDPLCTVFLTLAGPLVPGGLRAIITDLIENEYVNVIVSTGANMVHDIVEALGHHHLKGAFSAEDRELRLENIGRIGDIYIEQKAFTHLEKWMYTVLQDIPETKRQRLSTPELLFEVGRHIDDPKSILAKASQKKIPIICPAFVDSIAGFHLWMFGKNKGLGLDPLLDVDTLIETVYKARKVGVIILGGGHPKHFALFANTFREGVDSAIQITMDRPESGGLSGASLNEAISWGKIKPEGNTVTVICDVSIAFPLIISAALEKIE